MAVRIPRGWILLAACACSLLAAIPAPQAEPRRPMTSATNELRWHLDQVLATAQTPRFRALDHPQRREEIRRISNGLFNWSAMSARALGDEWRTHSAAERGKFADRFAMLAERAYMGSVDYVATHGLTRELIRYLGETTEGADTVVRTSLLYPREMPVDFLMRKSGARWEVRDVRVDGVSVADNYAAQFRRVRAHDSFAGLSERMAAKAAEPSEEPLVALGGE
jgi:phospholipid transport system substrate-binding protein